VRDELQQPALSTQHRCAPHMKSWNHNQGHLAVLE
jgi:hypothetical protein